MNDRLSWALAAFQRAARPLVRLALAMGLKHSQLEQILRELLLEEARHLWRQRGVAQPNISQLSLTTGLNRKEVTTRVRKAADALPHTESSAAAYCFTLWQALASHDAHLRRLPVGAAQGDPSFESVARKATRGNFHYRTVLTEMIGLGLVQDHGMEVELTASAFIPSRDLQSMLAFLGDHGRDHLMAAVSNTLETHAPFLERSVYAAGLDEAACQHIQTLTRERWNSLHAELVTRLGAAVDQVQGAGDQRIRIGIYTYFEDRAPAGDPAKTLTPDT